MNKVPGSILYLSLGSHVHAVLFEFDYFQKVCFNLCKAFDDMYREVCIKMGHSIWDTF